MNLHALACELARNESKGKTSGYDECVIGAETTLAALGRLLRASTPERRAEIVAALTERGGERAENMA